MISGYITQSRSNFSREGFFLGKLTANYYEGHFSLKITKGVMKVLYLLAGFVKHEFTSNLT